MNNDLIYGIGVNDADYAVEICNVKKDSTGVRKKTSLWKCPFHVVWTDMLKRCYSKKYLEKTPSYIGCYVAPEWLIFSNFRKWMEEQDYAGKELDKDILIRNNKVYSSDTCVFISPKLNRFILDCKRSRGEFPLGVCFHKKNLNFVARCRHNGTRIHLGCFNSPLEAHEAWREYKHKVALELANMQTDVRVAEALRIRYAEGTVHE